MNSQHILLISVIKALEPMKLSSWGTAEVNPVTMETNVPGVFCGGDFAGFAQTTVESVNDGKTAAWFMHKYMQVSFMNAPLFCMGVFASYSIDIRRWCIAMNTSGKLFFQTGKRVGWA